LAGIADGIFAKDPLAHAVWPQDLEHSPSRTFNSVRTTDVWPLVDHAQASQAWKLSMAWHKMLHLVAHDDGSLAARGAAACRCCCRRARSRQTGARYRSRCRDIAATPGLKRL